MKLFYAPKWIQSSGIPSYFQELLRIIIVQLIYIKTVQMQHFVYREQPILNRDFGPISYRYTGLDSWGLGINQKSEVVL